MSFQKSLHSLLQSPNWNQAKLSEAIGVKQATVSRWLSGKSEPTIEPVRKLARIAGVTVDEFLNGNIVLTHSPITYLTVRKHVAAGQWRPVEDPDASDFEPFSVPVVLDHPYNNVFAVRVLGDSMDQEYQPGSVLICVPLLDWGRDLKPGDHVIVERRDGADVEYTCKELWRALDGVMWLRPKSDNPEHAAIRVDSEPNGVEVTITAVVEGAIIKRSGS